MVSVTLYVVYASSFADISNLRLAVPLHDGFMFAVQPL